MGATIPKSMPMSPARFSFFSTFGGVATSCTRETASSAAFCAALAIERRRRGTIRNPSVKAAPTQAHG
jgi:hypothetical protein